MFAAEADGLGDLRLPQRSRAARFRRTARAGRMPTCFSSTWCLRPLRDGNTGRAAGMALADLHRIEARRFGWHRDNFIGSTPQHNEETDDWPSFAAGA